MPHAACVYCGSTSCACLDTDEEYEQAARPDEKRAVQFVYTNHHGEVSTRRVVPLGINFASNGWHPEPQWLMDGFDLEKQAVRTFALKDVMWWKPAPAKERS